MAAVHVLSGKGRMPAVRDAQSDPAVRRRLAVARFARTHTKVEAAHHFGCCWKTIQATLRRVEQYEHSQDVQLLQNKPRGQPHRSTSDVEDRVIAIYRESFTPERPHHRRYSAAKVARLLQERHHISVSRKTAWLILHRRGVWEEASGDQQAIQRFEREKPNELWQIDFIENEPTAIGDVYGIPIIDDHSRYLVGLRFFLSKGQETALQTAYQAMMGHGTPAEILCDRGGAFVDATGVGRTAFQDMLDTLGITLTIAPRAQTKGKEERINQFIERDLLDEVRYDIKSLADLNARGDTWGEKYNTAHVNETTGCTPASRYEPGVKVDPLLLKQLVAREERRKVSREATITYQKHHFAVPEKYIGWSVWVANYFDEYVEITAGKTLIGRHNL
jgi:transposase